MKEYQENVITEGLNSPECMQNLEKQVGQIFKMLKKRENRQIKDECQLTDLGKGVDFITQKFDEYEKDRRKKDAIINCAPSKWIKEC